MQTIRITAEGASEPSVGGARPELPLTRRQFLKGSGVLFGTIAIGSPLAMLAPSPAWALELKALDSRSGETLLKFGRTLYPHETLPDAVYALLVKDLDAMAGADPQLAEQLRQGVLELDQAAGGAFSKASAAKQMAAVRALEGTPFFATVRGKCVTSLYDNEMTWVAFGYPGESWSKGGYIARGFQDLKWLPAPPESASPPPYMG
ncbi:MAG: twin-arginine translocation signal domain-containing protein [Rhodocyclaceae bacterium]